MFFFLQFPSDLNKEIYVLNNKISFFNKYLYVLNIERDKMENIKLSTGQIVDLINNKRVLLSSDKVVELFNEEIIYNNNGKISKLNELNLRFLFFLFE